MHYANGNIISVPGLNSINQLWSYWLELIGINLTLQAMATCKLTLRGHDNTTAATMSMSVWQRVNDGSLLIWLIFPLCNVHVIIFVNHAIDLAHASDYLASLVSCAGKWIIFECVYFSNNWAISHFFGESEYPVNKCCLCESGLFRSVGWLLWKTIAVW